MCATFWELGDILKLFATSGVKFGHRSLTFWSQKLIQWQRQSWNLLWLHDASQLVNYINLLKLLSAHRLLNLQTKKVSLSCKGSTMWWLLASLIKPMRKKEAQQKGLGQSSLPASLERKDGVGGGVGGCGLSCNHLTSQFLPETLQKLQF